MARQAESQREYWLQDAAQLLDAPLALIRPDQIVAWRGHEATHAHAILAQALGLVPG